MLGREALRRSGVVPLFADLTTLAALLHGIAPAPNTQKPEYKFCRDLLHITISILNNLLLDSRETKSYLFSCSGLVQTLANLISQRKGNLQEEWILVSVATLVRNMA